MRGDFDEYNFAVWTTHHGGLVQWDADRLCYRFAAAPEQSGFKVGDEMPEEWHIQAANTEARTADAAGLDFQIGLDEFYDVLFEKIDSGNISIDQAARFFPSEYRHAA